MAEGFPSVYYFILWSQKYFLHAQDCADFLLFTSRLDIPFAFNCVFHLYTCLAELHSFHMFPVINMLSFQFPITNK